jgi:hypothetical protein
VLRDDARSASAIGEHYPSPGRRGTASDALRVCHIHLASLPSSIYGIFPQAIAMLSVPLPARIGRSHYAFQCDEVYRKTWRYARSTKLTASVTIHSIIDFR